jgi:hypothetical protein
MVLLATAGLMVVGVAMVTAAQAAPVTIVPGTVWKDTAGNVIQAHGAGMIQVGKVFYWFGEDHTGETSDQSFQNVACYSSSDLESWKFRGNALARQPDGDLGPNRVVERPKVIYNRSTRTFVMYMHIDSRNYAEAKVGVATSPTVTGPYTYHGSFRPLGHVSRDMTLFEDTDGKAYLVYEDRARGVGIELLSPDYLTVDHEVALIPHALEGNAVVKVGGVYFMLGSHLSGWAANDNQYVTAPSMSGPWSDPKDVAPAGTHTFNSQSAYILPVVGSKTTSYIYIGDRWKGNDLQDSRYIWMPLTIQGHTMSLAPDVPWTIDVATGEVAESGTANRPAE